MLFPWRPALSIINSGLVPWKLQISVFFDNIRSCRSEEIHRLWPRRFCYHRCSVACSHRWFWRWGHVVGFKVVTCFLVQTGVGLEVGNNREHVSFKHCEGTTNGQLHLSAGSHASATHLSLEARKRAGIPTVPKLQRKWTTAISSVMWLLTPQGISLLWQGSNGCGYE